MNIRQIAHFSQNYYEFNREERNYAALLYHALLNRANMKAFLDLCDINKNIGENYGIYFEFALLRDLWSKIGNDQRREIIRLNLRITGIDDIMSKQIEDINKFFGVAGTASKIYIQSPGKWAISKFDKNIADNSDFEAICTFKWSFNIKPDIVILLDNENAVCIEAKYESGEGAYPSQERDKKIFNDRGIIKSFKQINMQKYMMEELLGYKTDFVFIVHKEEKSQTHRTLFWEDVFSRLDLSNLPRFADVMVKKISNMM